MNIPTDGLLHRHKTLVVITGLIEECARNVNCPGTPNTAIEFFCRGNDDLLAQHGLVAVYRHRLLEFSESKWLSGWVPQRFHTVVWGRSELQLDHLVSVLLCPRSIEVYMSGRVNLDEPLDAAPCSDGRVRLR